MDQTHANQRDSFSDQSESAGSSRVGYSGPLSGPLVSHKRNSSKRSARFKDDDCLVEITLDVRDDTVSVQNIRGGDTETAYLASQLEKRPSSLGSQLSFKLRQVSQELKRMTSSKRFNKVDRSKSGAARAIQGLKFMSENVGSEGWSEVEARFDEMAVNGMLSKSRFSQCIGTQQFGYTTFDS